MKKGFTLIELLAVLVILGLIGVLVFPAVERTIKGVRSDLYEVQKETIISGLKNWIADHPRSLPEENGDTVYVSLGQLKLGAYVDMKISNPSTGLMFDTATKVLIKRENNKYKYEVLLSEDGLTEEEVTQNLLYPKLSLIGSEIVYLNVNDRYDDEGLNIENTRWVNGVLYDDVNYNIIPDSSNINTSSAGSYYMKYTVINRSNGTKIVLYRTVIVR